VEASVVVFKPPLIDVTAEKAYVAGDIDVTAVFGA